MTLQSLNPSDLEGQAAEQDSDTADAVAELSSTPEEETEETLSKDTIFELLKNQRRRDALAYLKANDGEATLSDMAEFIAAKENDITVQELSSSQRKRVYIGLYQCHLPKMASAGVIDFEKNRGDITIRPLAEQLEPFLNGDVEAESSSGIEHGSRVNLLVATAVSLGVIAGLAGAPLFTLVPDAGWAVISTAVLMGLTAFEAVRQRDD